VEFCPRGVLEMSKSFNKKGYHFPEVVKPDLCVECDLCEVICPDFAIFCLPADGGGEQPQVPAEGQTKEVKDAAG
jgi:2-oxoglutarate ferredoxin oxidoreductase subunit delta